MASLKKVIAAIFDFVGDFRQDPPACILLGMVVFVATLWWIVFVFPISIPLATLKDWSKHDDKSLWCAYKDNFRGPVQ